MLLFEWDPQKAKINLQKHGITFDEASTIFKDTLSLTIDDPLHSQDEERSIIIGISQKNRFLTVVHVETSEKIRINWHFAKESFSDRCSCRNKRKNQNH